MATDSFEETEMKQKFDVFGSDKEYYYSAYLDYLQRFGSVGAVLFLCKYLDNQNYTKLISQF